MSTGRPGGGGGGGGGGTGGGSGSGPMGRIVDKIKRTMTNEGGVSVPVIRPAKVGVSGSKIDAADPKSTCCRSLIEHVPLFVLPPVQRTTHRSSEPKQ
ncbi:hypothetical protein ZHAS_00018813 [Anopheles sinensis]|uniref:Uncharacterized protein n=1 Tax=Anopheles sinensis TaxID=74873 RepID=A0A084WKM1_ANOSI|nr:hypothetical protein ZHAS_00018813 [Anopheles sinensis]